MTAAWVKTPPKYNWRKPLPNLTLDEVFTVGPGVPNNHNSVKTKGSISLPGTRIKR